MSEEETVSTQGQGNTSVPKEGVILPLSLTLFLFEMLGWEVMEAGYNVAPLPPPLVIF